jgi:hypothetical protein
MVQKLVLRNEVIKVKGRVKVITVKKEDFFKVLKLTKLRVLDKEYEALMPPLDGLQKNTIDVNGLATLVQQYMTFMIFASGNTSSTTPAEMILTTSGGNITLPYTSSISLNSQGVTIYIQVFQESGNYTFQYFYIGFDTTSNAYSTSQLELYVSAYVTNQNNYITTMFTNTVRIAYTSASFSKSSDSYLFIAWLIEFQNIPPYLVYFTPILQNNAGIVPQSYLTSGTGSAVYFNNGSCNFACGGNCPSSGLNGFIMYIQNNSVVLEFPITTPLGKGVSTIEVLLCDQVYFKNFPTISGSTSATLTPPVSGATFYAVIATITVTYQGS